MMEGEFLDWELVHGSDTESFESITSYNKSASSSVIDDGDFEAADGNHVEGEADASKCLSESDNLQVNVECQSVVEEPIEDPSKSSWSDSGGNELGSGDSGIVSTESIEGSGENTVQVGAVRSGDDESKISRDIVWWKMPIVILKYCAFRIGPVWSVSMAAAVMGLVLLGRRLYNMKKNAQRFHLKLTIDDKKVSRVMSQAAQLNEVFTEVRRVPLIRPALQSPGTWPVLSLR